jgi:dihydrodipicolinate synthase/N-acetylneuraminate lyase
VPTLFFRSVPDEVAERLERLATQAGLPLSVFAVRELTEASLRANAASQLAALPDLAVPTDAIVAALGSERDER